MVMVMPWMLLILFVVHLFQTLKSLVQLMDAKLFLIFSWSVPQVCLELGASLVEGDGMSEGTDNSI